MSTQTRLDAYLATEEKILAAQEIRGGDRTFRMAELEEVRRAISDLQRQLARESSPRGLRYSLANLSRQ